MGQFKKGNKGRPKGAKNRKTREAKQVIENVLRCLDKTIVEDISKLSPKNRAELWLSLQSFVLPKLKSIEVEGISAPAPAPDPPAINLTISPPKEYTKDRE